MKPARLKIKWVASLSRFEDTAKQLKSLHFSPLPGAASERPSLQFSLWVVGRLEHCLNVWFRNILILNLYLFISQC